MILCSILILFSFMRPSYFQITKQNENYCFDDPRVIITGVIGIAENNSVVKFAGKERFGKKHFHGKINELSKSLTPLLNPLNIKEGTREYQYNYFKIKKPFEMTIEVQDFLYFRVITAEGLENKYRLLGFVQSWLGCPEPLCFSATLDAANLFLENEFTTRRHIFRGAFVWDISGAAPLIERATAISDRFPGMPSHIDAAVSLGMENIHTLEMFIFKDEFVYHSINNGAPRINKIKNKFPTYEHSSVQAAYVDRYEPHSVTKIYLFYGNKVSVYNYGREFFTPDRETILTRSLTNIEAAFTIYDSSNLDNSYVFVFKSWTCTRIGYKSLNLPGFDPERYKTEEAITKTARQLVSFEYPFNCTRHIGLYNQPHWGIEDYESFKELYYSRLRSVHTKKEWIYIRGGGKSLRSRKITTILLSVLAALVLFVFGVAIFLVIFTTNKARKPKGMSITDTQITGSKIEAGIITPSQLLEAGIATPSLITGVAESAIASTMSSATPSQYLEAGYTASQLVEAGVATPSAIGVKAKSAPSAVLQTGYSPSQQMKEGVMTSSTLMFKEATPSTLLQIGYSPSQLVAAGVTTPSKVGMKEIMFKKRMQIGATTIPPTIEQKQGPAHLATPSGFSAALAPSIIDQKQEPLPPRSPSELPRSFAPAKKFYKQRRTHLEVPSELSQSFAPKKFVHKQKRTYLESPSELSGSLVPAKFAYKKPKPHLESPSELSGSLTPAKVAYKKPKLYLGSPSEISDSLTPVKVAYKKWKPHEPSSELSMSLAPRKAFKKSPRPKSSTSNVSESPFK
ncbi:hypothetical protein B4U79_17323 [Dinothrombium tinctorium]|uniref:Uncharacterized protein n=1 Tax=Dinothrombium tinctorium TaxID=1965070 RepID=A0A443RFE4_9ACAR|nr:hypothetical protein B4U79_17323 [Dinothrombium tinctorium]